MKARQMIDLHAMLADMKDVDYKNTLAVTALIDLLIQKGIFTREEFTGAAQRLDAAGE